MGDLVKAACECGYEKEELLMGAGFSSMETGKVFTVAYCHHCGNVQSVDHEDEPPPCETCHQQLVYYDVDFDRLSSRFEHSENAEMQKWYCPACKTNRLHFECMGLWD